MADLRCQHFAENPDSAPVAFASRTREAAERLARQYGGRAAASWRDLVADPDLDAVCISTPNTLHFEQALAAVENGKHTAVEYPLCQTMEQADALKAAADRRGVVLHHGLNVRSEPLFQIVSARLRDIGHVACARMTYFGGRKWYVVPELVGNIFLALHLHFIDYFRGWFGEVRSLVATRHAATAADGVLMHSGTILLECERCPAAYIEFGMGYPNEPAYTAQIVGARGLILKDRQVVVASDDQETAYDLGTNASLKTDTDSFVAQAVRGAPPLRTWEDGRKTLEVCLACSRSAETGERLVF
jgi:predicted dehydrogenase